MAKYTLEEKDIRSYNAIWRVIESYISIGRSIGTSESVIMNWVKQYEYHGIEGLTEEILYKLYSTV